MRNAAFIYYVIGGLSSFVNNMIFPIMSFYYFTKVGFDPLQLVLAGTFLEIALFVGEIPTGVVADTYSRKLSVIIGVCLVGIAFGMQSFAPSYWLIMSAQIVLGIGFTFLSGAESAWITDEVGVEQVGKVFLTNTQVSQVAGLLGIIAGVGLAIFELTLPFLMGGLLYIGLGIFLILVMPERGFKPLPRGERNTWQGMSSIFVNGIKVVRTSTVLIMLLLVSLFVGATSEGYDRLQDAHLLTQFVFPAIGNLGPVIWFGIIGIVGQILGFLTITIFRSRMEAGLTKPSTIAWMLMLTQGLQIVAVLIFALAGYFWLALAAMWLKAMLSAVIEPLYNTWLNQCIPSQVRATVLSINSQANAVGQIAGGPGIGAIGSIFSIRAALVVADLLLLPTLLLYARFIRSHPSENEVSGLENL